MSEVESVESFHQFSHDCDEHYKTDFTKKNYSGFPLPTSCH